MISKIEEQWFKTCFWLHWKWFTFISSCNDVVNDFVTKSTTKKSFV